MDRIYLAYLDHLVRCAPREGKASCDPSARMIDGLAAIELAKANARARHTATSGSRSGARRA